MNLCSRSRAVQLGLATAVVLLTGAVLVSSAPARSTPDLSGVWVPSPTPDGSRYALFSSADRSTLTVNWTGSPGPHGSLVGSFQGALNASGTAYTGTMYVTEGGTTVTGTMTWTIDPFKEHFGSPQLDVTYHANNGTGGSFDLQILLLPARVAPGTQPAVQNQFDCPSGGSPCEGVDQGDPTASEASPFLPATVAASTSLGSSHFSVPAGTSKKIGFRLNQRARKLLAKRGTLKVKVRIVLSQGSGLPHVIKLGIVTFHKH
jgi:hypothetical protein